MASISASACRGPKDAAIEADATAFLVGRLSHMLASDVVDGAACATICARAICGIARVMRSCGVSEDDFESAVSMLGGDRDGSYAMSVEWHA